VWTIAWATVPHRLVDNVVGFPSGNRLAFRVYLGKMLPERPDDLLASLIGYGGWLESPNAHGLLLQYGPPEQAFDCHRLPGLTAVSLVEIQVDGELSQGLAYFRTSRFDGTLRLIRYLSC
jgi:hypothetical protein